MTCNHIVFIVMDSCRYDGYVAAKTPNMDRVGKVELRYSYASWTAPSHHAFAMGMLPHASPKNVFAFGDKSVHFDALELRVRGQVFQLTLMETNVLSYLVQHEGKPVSRKALLEDVWGLHEDTDTRAIDNFIVRLRRYIEDDPTKPRHLLTVRGVGYRFVSSPAKAKE